MQQPPSDPSTESPKGCLATIQSLGLALYAMLLLSFVGAGLFCGMGSLYSLLRRSTTPDLGLVSGALLEPWRLAEFRRLEIIGENETPALYHDSSIAGDGSTGCLVNGEKLIAFEDSGARHQGIFIRGSNVSVMPTQAGVSVEVSVDNQSVSCAFYSEEDGNRFGEMLRSEAQKTQPGELIEAAEATSTEPLPK